MEALRGRVLCSVLGVLGGGTQLLCVAGDEDYIGTALAEELCELLAHAIRSPGKEDRLLSVSLESCSIVKVGQLTRPSTGKLLPRERKPMMLKLTYPSTINNIAVSHDSIRSIGDRQYIRVTRGRYTVGLGS